MTVWKVSAENQQILTEFVVKSMVNLDVAYLHSGTTWFLSTLPDRKTPCLYVGPITEQVAYDLDRAWQNYLHGAF